MAAVAGVGYSSADASLIIDVRAVTLNGQPIGGLNNSKSISGAVIGDIIGYEVHAVVAGTDANTANDGFNTAKGSLASTGTGTVQVNLTHLMTPTFSSLFNATTNPTAHGTPSNLGGDTDTDIGVTLTPTNATVGNIQYRAGASSVVGLDQVIGTGNITVSETAANAAAINFIIGTTTATTNDPNWLEDGVAKTAKTVGVSYGVGAPLLVATGEVPEPASLGLLSLGALSLLGRRRRA